MSLKQTIEVLRSQMISLADQYGRGDSRVLDASERLDELINEAMKSA